VAYMEKRIILVGVGHVFDISNQVNEIIDKINPDIVAIELDRNRLSFLMNPNIQRGHIPLFYRALANMQDRLANKYGVSTGSEMTAAVKKAEESNIWILCIDKDVQHVLGVLWKGITLRRKILFLFGIFSSLFISKKKVEHELQLFEENPLSYFDQMSEYFPEFKKILIDDRNEFMYQKLIKSLDTHDKVVAFVGEGHILGLENLLKKHTDVSFDIIHLKELRENNFNEII
jgi:pheromone shutdown protein TraB